jgi:PTH1 family peptidyl-tRNA hydrolase
MRIYIGLGNPGDKYKNNRHNVGFQFVDFILQNLKNKGFVIKSYEKFDSKISEVILNDEKYLFVKPQIFMNNSGIAVKKILDFYKEPVDNLNIIHDDLDIPFGNFKIQYGSGPKLHNGILSIEKHLKTNNFKRIRIGIDDRNPENNIDGETYVLSDFTMEEQTKLKQVFIKVEQEIV